MLPQDRSELPARYPRERYPRPWKLLAGVSILPVYQTALLCNVHYQTQLGSGRQSQNQSYSESRSGIVDGKMRAAEQRMIWKSGQKMTQIVSVIVPVTADCEKAGDALRAAEDCGKAGNALRAEDLREDLRGLNAGRKRPATNDDEEADIQRRQLDPTNLTHFYMRDLGDRGLWPDRRSGGCDVKCLARSSSRSRIERLGKRN